MTPSCLTQCTVGTGWTAHCQQEVCTGHTHIRTYVLTHLYVRIWDSSQCHRWAGAPTALCEGSPLCAWFDCIHSVKAEWLVMKGIACHKEEGTLHTHTQTHTHGHTTVHTSVNNNEL